MEACDEPHPENTSAHTAGAESNKPGTQAATWQEGAQSHILHNPLQVCELLPGALLPRRDAARELHGHARGAAGYIFTCFGKLGRAISRVKAAPHRRFREAQLARPLRVCRRVSQGFPRLPKAAAAHPCPAWLPPQHGAGLLPRTRDRHGGAQSKSAERRVARDSAVPACSPDQADTEESWHLLTPSFHRIIESSRLEKTPEIIESGH